MKVKRGLGKGLDALFPQLEPVHDTGPDFRLVPLEQIVGNKQQPRKTFDDAKIQELSESIKQHGVLQPVVLRQVDERFELVVGERRWRAAVKAGLTEIPAVIRHVDDLQALEYGLIENLHRQDLNPLEEAMAYKMLLEMSGLTQEELANTIGIDRSTISNMVRLLGLPLEVKKFLAEGDLSIGHAKALLGLASQDAQRDLTQLIIAKQLSVRQTEEIVKKLPALKTRPPSAPPPDPHLAHVQETLTMNFGTKVRVIPGKKVGKIVIEYYSNDDLQRLLELLEP